MSALCNTAFAVDVFCAANKQLYCSTVEMFTEFSLVVCNAAFCLQSSSPRLCVFFILLF